MAGRRKETFPGWMPGLYRKVGAKRMPDGSLRTLYYTLLPTYTALGHDLSTARRKLLELQEKPAERGTIAELLDDFMAYRRAKSAALVKQGKPAKPSPRTLEDNEKEAANLKKVFGHMFVVDLEMHHAWRYIHEYRKCVRANREISLLSGALTYAANRGDIKTNPLAGLEKFEETPRDRLVTNDELTSFCVFAKANRHHAANSTKAKSLAGRRLALAARLSYLTAKAEAQIIGLQISDIEEDGIVFDRRKGGHAVLVLWTPKLRLIVKKLRALEPRLDIGPLVCTETGDSYTLDGFRSTWGRIMDAWAAAKEGRKRFTFHDLRAKAVSKLKEDGRIASELTGHTSEAMPNKVYDRRRIRRAQAVE